MDLTSRQQRQHALKNRGRVPAWRHSVTSFLLFPSKIRAKIKLPISNRVKAPEPIPHLDLLHCSRRIFSGVLESMRLVNLEEEVLEFAWVDDVPGFMIPGIFFQFLKDG